MTTPTTDRELLELVAKAAGYEYAKHGGYIVVDGIPGNWNPLTDDGDALRLAVRLKIDIEWQETNPFHEPRVDAYHINYEGTYFCADEPEEHYRRAIVRAAAEIGKAMP